MSEQTTRYFVPLLVEGQASQEITHNKAVDRISNLVHASVDTVAGTNTPPGSPADGDATIVGSSPTDEFVSHDGEFAYYSQGWYFATIIEGMLVWDQSASGVKAWNGSTWVTSLGAAGAAVANATDNASAILRLNDLLSRLRTLGIISP